MEKQLFTWINKEAEDRNWNYSELSRRAGISQSNLSLVLSGQRSVTWDFCAAIAKAFGERPEKAFRIAELLPASSGSMQDLSEDEAQLVEVYRQMSPALRSSILGMARGAVDQEQKPRRR